MFLQHTEVFVYFVKLFRKADDIQGRNDMTIRCQNDWREGGLSRKRKIFVSQNLCLYYRYLYGLVKGKKAEGLTFDF